MKRILLATVAAAAMTSASFAADPAAVYEEVDVWSGFFVGLQAGYAFKEVGYSDDDVTFDADDDEFIGGLYYGRNWQNGNLVWGLDSSWSWMGIEEEDIGTNVVDVEANILGLSRLKLGYAMDNVLVFAAAGVATTFVKADEAGDDDDDFALGWTVGAGIETKFSEHWSARIEYAYFDIESDDLSLDTAGDIEVDVEGHIVRVGAAYHF